MGEKTCQSCAMPILKSVSFGTNSDGTKNEEYCCFCYQKGKFLDEGISMDEKIEKIVRIGVDKLGMDENLARDMAKDALPRLKRWQK